jgi:glycosyltransferase involved in cell wall biosynthesis
MERSLSNLDLVLAPSKFTARMHRDILPRITVEVLALPGPTPDAVDAAPDTQPRARPYFLCAARLEPIKGIHTLIGAFADVTGADLLIAGSGSEERRLRAAAGGAKNVVFLGQLPYSQVLSLCRHARAVILPSVGYETFGGAAVDAMTMGTPAVVRNLGALPEIVSDGGGYTFSDDASLVRILQRLVDNPDEARALGLRAREVAQRWSEDRFFDRYFELISRATGVNDRR